ncbi:MAG: hypothetical protein J6Q47_02615 [Paludibacteraceae bacterium]|nr:hypothetical protein [Paludibacteraceae bacterium]
MYIKQITHYEAFGEMFQTEEEAKKFVSERIPFMKERLLKQKQQLKQKLLPQAYKEFMEAKGNSNQRTRKMSKQDLFFQLQEFNWKKSELESLQKQLERTRAELKEIYEYEEDIQKKN